MADDPAPAEPRDDEAAFNAEWADHSERLRQLQRRINESPGGKARARFDSLDRSVFVFRQNSHELMEVLRAGEEVDELVIELFQNVRPSPARETYFRLLDQRLHNMVSAAGSLIDHTRRVLQAYADTEFANQFATRNDVVRTEGGAVFLRNLRNYLLHYGVLGFSHSVSFKAGDERLKSQTRLPCDELRRWTGWGAAAKDFMTASGDEIHLRSVVESYSALMDELYGWVFAQFEVLHSDDIDVTNKIVEEFNLTLTGGTSDGRDKQARMAHLQENLQAFREGREQTDYVPPDPPQDVQSLSEAAPDVYNPNG